MGEMLRYCIVQIEFIQIGKYINQQLYYLINHFFWIQSSKFIFYS
ncbi:unnamed protein product [Paramecium pentaurelia]|uniref:Uncharacterized protein n=1 Tax=Paramecium pentaurelia TaxID=43138 RepID=A0A8S1URE1_9CILI|nr:unnamed protein product [Paramecium pentaurelia]